MSTINERIAFLIKDQGLTQSKFAERIHLAQSHISKICSGINVPTERTISDICREFNVSLAWLEDGEGEMYVQRSANDELALLVTDIMSDADDSFRKRFISLLMALPPEKWSEIENFVKKIKRRRLTVSVYFCILVEGGILSFRYWLMYLGASLLIYVVAALLNHWRMCKDPDNKTVSGSLVFILTIILGHPCFPCNSASDGVG